MPDSRNLDEMIVSLEAVDDSARLADNLSDHGVSEFRDDPARFREIGKTFDGVEDTLAKTGCGLGIEFRQVGQDVPKNQSGLSATKSACKPFGEILLDPIMGDTLPLVEFTKAFADSRHKIDSLLNGVPSRVVR